MKIAFELVKFFPYGGVQLDMLRMARACAKRGHKVVIFCSRWQGEKPDCAEVRVVKLHSLSNHGRVAELGEKVFEAVKKEGGFAGIVGFVRTSHLDVFFAGDNCYKEILSGKNFFSRHFSLRHRKLAALENKVFGPGSKTVSMMIVPAQLEGYRRSYRLEDSRLRLLPPGIRDDCTYPGDEKAAELRAKFREEHDIRPDDVMLCLVGANFKRKGGDALLDGCALLPPETKKRLVIAYAGAMLKTGERALSERAGARVMLLGQCGDIDSLLLASDLMVHPALEEAAGSVLLEALTMHLPVVCTENCGFSPYVRESGGTVVPASPPLRVLASAIAEAIPRLGELKRRASEYAEKNNFKLRAEKAAEIIEEVCSAKEKDCI